MKFQMQKLSFLNKGKVFIFLFALFFQPVLVNAQTDEGVSFFPNKSIGFIGLMVSLVILAVILIFFLVIKLNIVATNYLQDKKTTSKENFKKLLSNLTGSEIESLKKIKNSKNTVLSILIIGFLSLFPQVSFGQTVIAPAKREDLFSEPGVLITLVLVFIPLLLALMYLSVKVYKGFNNYFNSQRLSEAKEFAEYIADPENIPAIEKLEELKQQQEYSLSSNELSGGKTANDNKGLLNNVSSEVNYRFFANKRPPIKRPKIDPELTKLILWFLGTAVFWLFVGSSVGEYVGIKFVAPDADTYSWLSIGRLRAVHTNLVFWAWSTIGIMGLGYYIVPMVSNAHSIKNGWIALVCVNAAMFVGAITIMAGINNGGGEYREIIWPIMAVWGYGLLLTVINFIKTIAKRTTHEIYISNWFIVASYIFILIVATLAYIPMGQDGIGETIVQGYYMHQAVGMWFMFSMLGVLYYILPQQLNKPIYSYSLGVLAFWSQILFYTTIGTHHFVFSALPWWLQTVAIIGSVGMLIPVTSGTINYLMTFKGSWSKVSNSYSLPFLLVGVIYYFTGSFQGTAEAFRSTNLIWHFTDFTIAHSHITMYGIITFLLFGSIYAIVPRLTGKEPPQLGVGIHFWLALIGLQFYTIPLMIGGTLKGLMWAEGKPFIDSVVMMAPFWLWRAIGGSLMWLSHIVLAYNMYKMMQPNTEIDVKEKAFEILNQNLESNLVEPKN